MGSNWLVSGWASFCLVALALMAPAAAQGPKGPLTKSGPTIGRLDRQIGPVTDAMRQNRRALYALNIKEPLVAPPGAPDDTPLKFQQCVDPTRLSAQECPVLPEYKQWAFDPETKRIVHVDSGKCLSLDFRDMLNESSVILKPCSNDPGSSLGQVQRWSIEQLSTGTIWTITPVFLSTAGGAGYNHCLQADPAPATPGRNVKIKPGPRVAPPGPQVGVEPGSTNPSIYTPRTPARLTYRACNSSESQRFATEPRGPP